MSKFTGFIGRILLSQIFLGAVLIKISSILSDPDGYSKYQMLLAQLGLPGIFAPLIILIQVIGGLALFLGYKTKAAAYLLAAFSLFLALILSFQVEILMLYLAITGGLLLLATNPQTPFSLDNLKK
ncbi:MAG: DoxX family protein [Methylophilaceae bacterium]